MLINFFLHRLLRHSTLEAATPEARVTLRLKGAPLEQIMNEIETQTRYLFIVDQGVKTDRGSTSRSGTNPLPTCCGGSSLRHGCRI